MRAELLFGRSIGTIRHCIWITLIACSLHVAGLAASASFAQAVVLRENDGAPFLTGGAPEQIRFYVNGPTVVGLDPDTATKTVAFGRFGRLLLTITALKLSETGKLDLDVPLHTLLPDLIDERAFEPVLTSRHLMAEVAGFAVPPWYRPDDADTDLDPGRAGVPLARYILHLRYAGRMYHDDVVAAALLAELIARQSGKPVIEAVNTLVTDPLGLSDQPVSLIEATDTPAPFQAVLDQTGPIALIIALMRQLFDQPRAPLLGTSSQLELTGQAFWRFHPMGLTRTLGLERRIIAGQPYLGLGGPACETGTAIAVLPAQDIAFIQITPHKDTCARGENNFAAVTAALAFQHIPPGPLGDAAIEEAASMRRGERIAGFYVRETLPRADLKSRLMAIHAETRFLKPLDGGNEVIFRRGPDSRRFTAVSPLAYVAAAGAGEDTPGTGSPSSGQGQLIFSPIGGQGYLRTDATDIYRFIGLLGDRRLVLSPFPWMMILMLSGGLHVLNRTSAIWRRLGRNALAGTVLFGTGLALELNYWADALYVLDAPVLVLLWRLMLNAGLALLLAVTLTGLQIARRKTDLPLGPMMVPVSVHLALLTAGGVILFMLTVAWGIAGELWPY